MILAWIGRAFEAVGRIRPGRAGEDRVHFGGELVRLDRPAQSRASSR